MNEKYTPTYLVFPAHEPNAHFIKRLLVFTKRDNKYPSTFKAQQGWVMMHNFSWNCKRQHFLGIT